jgi:hypothetical protein
MAGIVVSDTIKVTSEIGESQIQICIGDIIKLPKEEKVDVLVVSAFPGKKIITNGLTHYGATLPLMSTI